MPDFFPSAWAVVVDDQDDDATGILRALSKAGIPSVRFDGDELMPESALPNVRLLILDLELVTGVLDIKATVGIVFQILAPTQSSGPCLIILWTAHEENIEEFKSTFERYNEERKEDKKIYPLSIAGISKSVFLEKDEDNENSRRHYKQNPLVERIKEELSQHASLRKLLQWEALNGRAAARATAGLYQIASLPTGNNENPNQVLEEIFTDLARAQMGRSAGSADEKRRMAAAYEILAVLQGEMVQRLAACSDGEVISLPVRIAGAAERKAALNTILLTSGQLDPKRPGAVVPGKDLNVSGVPFEPGTENKSYREFLHCIFKGKYRDKAIKARIQEKCLPVFVEITPGCDHAQNKRRQLRFVPGVLVCEPDQDIVPERADHLRNIGPLISHGQVALLIIDTQHFFTLPLDAELPEALFCLRDHVRTDIQAWLGSQLARPGHLSLEN